jgi:hypothetical protein
VAILGLSSCRHCFLGRQRECDLVCCDGQLKLMARRIGQVVFGRSRRLDDDAHDSRILRKLSNANLLQLTF